MAKKKILVTGGAGFIGSNLIEQLVKGRANEIYSLDNYSTGSKDNHVAGANYIKGDTQDIARLVNIKPDLVFHLGEYARVEKSFDDMPTVWHSNKDGTFAVLEFCRDNGAKIVYAGSSTKFGDGGLGRDQSPYAWTKASNTELVKNYGAWFNLKHAITYFYNEKFQPAVSRPSSVFLRKRARRENRYPSSLLERRPGFLRMLTTSCGG